MNRGDISPLLSDEEQFAFIENLLHTNTQQLTLTRNVTTVSDSSGSAPCTSNTSEPSVDSSTIVIVDDEDETEVEEVERPPSDYHVKTRFGKRQEKRQITKQRKTKEKKISTIVPEEILPGSLWKEYMNAELNRVFEKVLSERKFHTHVACNGDSNVEKKIRTSLKPPLKIVMENQQVTEVFKQGMDSYLMETLEESHKIIRAKTMALAIQYYISKKLR